MVCVFLSLDTKLNGQHYSGQLKLIINFSHSSKAWSRSATQIGFLFSTGVWPQGPYHLSHDPVQLWIKNVFQHIDFSLPCPSVSDSLSHIHTQCVRVINIYVVSIMNRAHCSLFEAIWIHSLLCFHWSYSKMDYVDLRGLNHIIFN
jgi:hypothetical protein